MTANEHPISDAELDAVLSAAATRLDDTLVRTIDTDAGVAAITQPHAPQPQTGLRDVPATPDYAPSLPGSTEAILIELTSRTTDIPHPTPQSQETTSPTPLPANHALKGNRLHLTLTPKTVAASIAIAIALGLITALLTFAHGGVGIPPILPVLVGW